MSCYVTPLPEDEILKDLIETNIRQRGDVGGSDIKLGNRIKELERVYGIRKGRPENSTNGGNKVTQEDLLAQLGLNKETYRRAKALASLPPEIQDLVEQGTISPSTASRLIAKLTPEEQEKLVATLPVVDYMTQKQVQSYVDQIQAKDNQIAGYALKVEQDKKKIKIIYQIKKYFR